MRLIDADAIDYDEFWHREGAGFTINVCQKAQQIIDEQPTIERPKGEWIIHGEPPIYVRECPECGAKYHYAKEWGEVNYCSNCGADCRGDTE